MPKNTPKDKPINTADTLYIIMPAYNEEANIEETVRQWHLVAEKTGENSRLLIVNDGSRDGTLAKLMELSFRYPKLAIADKPNSGHGPTVIYGYQKAIQAGADYIFQTDSDGQTDPDEFWAFWEGREGHDAIFGVRKVRGDGRQRKFVEDVLCKILKFFFHVDLSDANAPFRLYKAGALAEELAFIPKDYNLPNAVLTAFFVKHGRAVSFKEITFRPRQGGTNSINVKKIIKIGIKALKDFRRLSKEEKEREKKAGT